MATIKQKKRRVKCIYCHKPIHIDKFAGIQKKGLFCNDMLCLIKLIREDEHAGNPGKTRGD